ncbi:MAG: M24 family metallopeptidase, partial [Pseudomonadota bacterium]
RRVKPPYALILRLLMAIYAQYEGDTTVSALAGLAKSIKKAGVTRGKIGFDDPRVGAWLQQEGLKDIKVHDAANTFREIRMVKTPVEVEILRQAAQKNEDALLYAINNTSVGQSLDDIEFAHGKRWGELGGSTLWCITNQRGIASGVIAPNTVTKIDSVGQYKAYRGDVGRTVVWGTASDEVMKRNEANTKALRITYDAIHPGMTFGESSKIMRDVMQQAGISRGGGGAHPVGLEHTDHPWPTGAEQSPDELFTNFVYEENMVFTMDVPYHEVGYGTSHVEDMMVVKKTKGCEGLSSMDTRLIVRPA